MFLSKISGSHIKIYNFNLKLCRRFSNNPEIQSKLFKTLKDEENITNFPVHSLKLDLIDKYKENHLTNEVLSKKSLDLSKIPRCVSSDSPLTSDILTHSHNCDNLSAYKDNKDFIINSFINLLNFKNKNPDLFQFLCDSLSVIIKDLNFDESYKLIKVISNEKLCKSNFNYKISNIFHNLLTRLNHLITEKLTYNGGILKVNELPKYSGYLKETCLDRAEGINFDSDNHLEKLWNLWFILSKQTFEESKYTASLILALLEQESGSIFKFDLRRVCRALDVVVGDCKFFSKLEERFILILLKRFSAILSNIDNKHDPEFYIKSNNVTPIQIKKFFCNISKISKISHKILENFLKLENSHKSLQDFVNLSSVLLNNELDKLDVSQRSFENLDSDWNGYFDKNLKEVNYKRNKLFLKIFVDSLEIVKFLDHLILCETNESDGSNVSDTEELRDKLLKLSHDLLIKISVESEEHLLQECRSMYYMLLTCSLCKPTIPDTLSVSKLTETISNKIALNVDKLTSDSRILAGDLNSGENKSLGMKTVQFMLYCDKINSLLRLLGSCGETSNKVNLSCEKLVIELFKNQEKLLSSNQSQGLKTLYVTLLNKYGVLSPEIYYEFLNTLEDWPNWERNELSMLCDILSRTYPNYCSKIVGGDDFPDNQQLLNSRVSDKIIGLLVSLTNYVFVDDNVCKFSNKELISILNFLNTCLDGSKDKPISTDSYNPTFIDSMKPTIMNKLSERISDMNFSQLVKLLSFHNVIEESFRDDIVQRILNLDYLGDISCLVELNDPKITSKVLTKFKIKVVEESYVTREKSLKTKFLKHYKKPQLKNNFVSKSNYETLKMLI
ncbi:uncharacterized protein TA16230 [Theileria annulata]|uniref:Uncharacterized protein n=1 Tax=Theileria annulata TaxID=5874 RepID=Q4UIS7_THEAN|nr:uncharacterized protein TA16230 [Theileria annulata]CAI73012.1 hypothetical protein TA16230 [Theileria annulata]|eukprot:XP_953690.1 hypothetical protein TA16230 [Theileria annulata]